MDAPVIKGRITRAIIVGPVPVRVAIAVRTVRITAVIGAAVVGVPAVIRVAAVVSSIKRNAYSDIPKYAVTATKAITTPMISVIASVRYKRLAVSRLDNARLGERGRRQRKCDNGTEN
jgi:hypothetical protein